MKRKRSNHHQKHKPAKTSLSKIENIFANVMQGIKQQKERQVAFKKHDEVYEDDENDEKEASDQDDDDDDEIFDYTKQQQQQQDQDDGDDSDIIDDMEDLRPQKKRRIMTQDEEDGLVMSDDDKDNGAIYVDSEFKKRMEEREQDPDDVLIDYLEKRLGMNKKKKKQQQEESQSKESELKKYVEEKRAKKKQEKKDEFAPVLPDSFDDLPEYASDIDEEGDGLDALVDGTEEDLIVQKQGRIDDDSDNDGNAPEDENDDNGQVDEATFSDDDIPADDVPLNESDEEDDMKGAQPTVFDDDDEDDMIGATPTVFNDDDEDAANTIEEATNSDGNNEEQGDNDEEQQQEEPELPKPAPLPQTGKYIPPHLRAKMQQQPGTTERDKRYWDLYKQLKGLVNKLSQDNMVSITNEAIQLYQTSSKNGKYLLCCCNIVDYHEVLSDAVLDSICNNVNLMSQFVLVYAAFVVTLHNIAAMEVGAYFLEKLVQRYNKVTIEEQNRQISTNLQLLFSHLYNMGVCTWAILLTCCLYRWYLAVLFMIWLIYCAKSLPIWMWNLFTSWYLVCFSSTVMFVNTIFAACGYQLRQDDPQALKKIIEKVTQVSTQQPNLTGRFKFTLEMIHDLKNNKQRRVQQEEREKYTQINKLVKQMQNKAGKEGDHTLRIAYQDALLSNKKGRWWLVGSAWSGQDMAKKQVAAPENQDEITKALSSLPKESLVKWDKLAKEQRMTTEIKRAIFIMIMSSEDAADGFHNLSKIGLKRNDREIVRVLVHCNGQVCFFILFYTFLFG